MEGMNQPVFATEYPTLWPHMLLGRPHPAEFPPFAPARIQWYYFARNAVWQAVRLLGLAGAEVLVPSYHHGVEIEALVNAGAKPVFYRVGPGWQVDMDDVARRICPSTRALYLTHYAGFPGPVRAMKALAERHGLPLIEDCALSLLSSDGGRPLGTTGDVAIFCLYKTLPVPNGGALVINAPLAPRQPQLRSPGTGSLVNHTLASLLRNLEVRGGAFGYRLRRLARGAGHATVEAANVERIPTGTMHFNPAHVDLGISGLTLRIARGLDFEGIIAARRRNYGLLRGLLAQPPLMPDLPAGVCPLFYPLVVDDKPAVIARLRAAGVQCVNFWSGHHPACDPAEFPDVAHLRRSIVEIPCHQDLRPAAIERLARLIGDATQRREALTDRSSAA